MPLVEVSRNPALITNEAIATLVDALPQIAVDALTTQERALTLGDVDVRVRDFGPFEKTQYGLQITVSASHSDSRHKNLGERQSQIMQNIRSLGLLPAGIKAYVWLVLPPAAYDEFIT